MTNKKKLIAALRSNEYKQGKFALNTIDNGESTFCCLGVACELYMKENPIKKELFPQSDVSMKKNYYDDESTHLPEKVREWLGFATIYGLCTDGDTLTSKNDKGSTFGEIANLIENGEVL